MTLEIRSQLPTGFDDNGTLPFESRSVIDGCGGFIRQSDKEIKLEYATNGGWKKFVYLCIGGTFFDEKERPRSYLVKATSGNEQRIYEVKGT